MTFYHIYTVFALLVALLLVRRLLYPPRTPAPPCLHDWEPVVERELPSKAEELKKNGEDISKWNSYKELQEISSKTFFAIVSCKKCGGIKDYTVET